jgi:hypothetical protein
LKNSSSNDHGYGTFLNALCLSAFFMNRFVVVANVAIIRARKIRKPIIL